MNVESIQLRPYREGDERAVCALQRRGRLLVGAKPQLPLTLTEAEEAFFRHPPNHVWVAEIDGVVAGIAGMMHEQPMVARLAVLCIDAEWEKAGVPERLVEAVTRHCHYFGYLKLVVPAMRAADDMRQLLGRCGLRYTRQRGEKSESTPCLLEFYIDLYRRRELAPAEDDNANGSPRVAPRQAVLTY